MTDPNAPTPGTENQIDYDAIEKLAKHDARVGMFRTIIDAQILLALVKKARQRDEAEKEIEASYTHQVEFGYSSNSYSIDGLRFALDALRRTP